MITNRIRKEREDESARRERVAAFRRIQSDYLIYEQDFKKKTRLHETMVAELRQLKASLARLELTLREKAVTETKLARELEILQVDGARLKKRMNALN